MKLRRYLEPAMALSCVCGVPSPQPAVERAIPYVNGGTAEQVLDVNWSADVHAPLVLFIHGAA